MHKMFSMPPLNYRKHKENSVVNKTHWTIEALWLPEGPASLSNAQWDQHQVTNSQCSSSPSIQSLWLCEPWKDAGRSLPKARIISSQSYGTPGLKFLPPTEKLWCYRCTKHYLLFELALAETSNSKADT